VIARIEVQLSQLAASVGGRKKGQFPRQTVPNPRGQHVPQNTPTGQFEIGSDSNREVQAIHTLRLGPSPNSTKQSQCRKS